jgi:hypothetical protein
MLTSLKSTYFIVLSVLMSREPRLDDVPAILARYEYSAKQGIRPTMEDRHIHLPYIDVLSDRNVRSTLKLKNL